VKDELVDQELTLRRWRPSDEEELHRVAQESLPHLSPWMPWVTDDYPRSAAHDFVLAADAEWGVSFNYAIVVAGALAGASSLMDRIGPGGFEVGYWLHPSFVGRGIATRAAALLVAEAFRAGADRVEIVTDVANTRSAAIPVRLGFVEVDRRPAREPVTSGEVGTDIVWRTTPDRDPWGKAQGSS
jgi:RimJ/RimL family protein N-acetyltransferase